MIHNTLLSDVLAYIHAVRYLLLAAMAFVVLGATAWRVSVNDHGNPGLTVRASLLASRPNAAGATLTGYATIRNRTTHAVRVGTDLVLYAAGHARASAHVIHLAALGHQRVRFRWVIAHMSRRSRVVLVAVAADRSGASTATAHALPK